MNLYTKSLCFIYCILACILFFNNFVLELGDNDVCFASWCPLDVVGASTPNAHVQGHHGECPCDVLRRDVYLLNGVFSVMAPKAVILGIFKDIPHTDRRQLPLKQPVCPAKLVRLPACSHAASIWDTSSSTSSIPLMD